MSIDMQHELTRTMYRLLAGTVLLLGSLLPALPAYAIPPIQHWLTSNGLRVYYVHAPELPMVDLNITFAAGSARDGQHSGVAHMTSTLLDSGAAGLSADELASRIEALGAEIDTGSARDMAWVTLRSLSDAEYLQPALAILGDILGKPDFNKQDFERERERTDQDRDAWSSTSLRLHRLPPRLRASCRSRKPSRRSAKMVSMRALASPARSRAIGPIS